MGPALEKGDVDAAFSIEPFVTQSVRDSAEVLNYSYVETESGMQVGAYAAAVPYAEENADTIRRFQAEVRETAEYVTASEDEFRTYLSERAKIAPDLAKRTVLPRWTGEVDADSVQDTSDLMQRYGLVEQVFGWEHDTATFMARIVFSGVLERHPELKVLIHHGGSMVPHFAGRVGPGWDQLGARTPPDRRHEIEHPPLSKRPLDYFKMFYADTALFGAAHAIRCCIEFFGVDRILFASDTPFDPEKGPGYIRSTIENLESLELSDEDRAKIYEGNARRVLWVR